MEKRFFALMTVAAVAAALVSCNREKEVDVIEPAGDVSYRFELVGGTRATLNDDGVLWEANDQVGVFLGTQHTQAEVKGTDTKYVEVSGPSGVTKGYAYYPYAGTSSSSSSVKVVFPAEQTGGSHSAMPMAGIPFDVTEGSFNGQIYSLNLGSVIDFRVFSATYAGERVQSITFTATAGEHPACGEATINLTGVSVDSEESLAVSWSGFSALSDNNPSSVTLSEFATTAAVKEVAANGHMYMVVAPGTYSGTITVVTNAASYTFPFQNKTLARNAITRYNMNLDSSNATRESWYVKVLSADQIVNGGKYLIVNENEKKAFKPVLDGNKMKASSENVQTVTIENKGIRSTEEVDACQVVLNTASSGYYMQAVTAGGYYFYPNGSNISAGTTATATTISFVSDGVVNITDGINNYLRYSTYYQYFVSSSYNSTRELALYLRNEGPGEVQSLNFSASSFSYVLNDQPVPLTLSGTPTLSGAHTDVKYSSSNTSVATVDLSGGTVTVQGVGEAVITATADATNEYKGARASYRLTVYAEPTYSIENDRVAAFLDYEEAHPYDPDHYDYTYVMEYREGTSETNRLDLPKPVPLTWTTSVSNPTVVIYKDPAHTDEEIMAFTENETSTSANVYNLAPGRKYYYVVKEGQQVKVEGSFQTIGRRRMVKVGKSHEYGATHANNCRDLGGLPAMNGKTVKFGKLFRGTNMDDTNQAEKNYLIEKMGIRLDVDLRAKGDGSGGSTKAPTPALDGITVYRTYDEEYDHWASNNPSNDSKALNNPINMKKTLGYIFQYIQEGKAAYIHCKIGSDRTAYVCLLLEAILGVPQHLCDVDYELTSFSYSTDDHLPRRRNDTSKSWYYYPLNGIPSITSASGSTFQEKAINYVKAMGISDEQIQAFQNAMLE